MSEFFGAIKELRDRIEAVDQRVLINTILNRPEFRSFIVLMNTEGVGSIKGQLFDLNINSEGVALSSIGGDYSKTTLALSNTPKKSKSSINLIDTGEYYESFRVDIGSLKDDFFTIDSDPEKDNGSLFDRWGEDIEGLTEENLGHLADKILEAFVPLFLEEILE